MINLFQKTAPEINLDIAKRMVVIRKRRKISQKELAKKSGVSLGSLKRFEQTGEISLLSLTKISIALGLEEEMENMFSEVPFDSIEEIINGQN
ncbi:MAG: helix-turn-helix domain-containing protein [Lachnospiraceae bacterium]